ncbi:hypothetical protein ASD65_15270 [Microbacterium sp. Root61]|uniref:hypothetical protein n=1 Tax=Microbacterium sp. Root61 TaxID=1736570 RepID=UPI0006F67E76|nr:hypothetical protein [Microbacterium sp. Root61]KRA25624.1 hypothetical protein ASD65_15270 [Microbacterium sp. Root61]
MTAPASPGGGSVRPEVALAFAVVGYVALAIFGLGMTSLVTNQEVISVPGLGQLPGIVGMTLSTAAFAGGLWAAVRRPHPSFWGVPGAMLGAFLGYLVGIWGAAVIGGTDLAAATAAMGMLATSWFGLVVLAAALVCAWSGIALVRTRAGRPRWPWERDDE